MRATKPVGYSRMHISGGARANTHKRPLRVLLPPVYMSHRTTTCIRYTTHHSVNELGCYSHANDKRRRDYVSAHRLLCEN